MGRRPLDRRTAEQIATAYNAMATYAHYRPAAPSDGFGNITEPLDTLDINDEAHRYAERWHAEENQHDFFVGSCNYPTRPATIYAVEAARLMCGGSDAEPVAQRLLQMALGELAIRAKQRDQPTLGNDETAEALVKESIDQDHADARASAEQAANDIAFYVSGERDADESMIRLIEDAIVEAMARSLARTAKTARLLSLDKRAQQ